jgi:TolA-binding protein
MVDEEEQMVINSVQKRLDTMNIRVEQMREHLDREINEMERLQNLKEFDSLFI